MDRPLALATCAVLPAEADESRLEEALRRAGVDFRWTVWDDPAVDWSSFAGVLIRTPWDYTAKVDAFEAWARRVDSCTVLLNPADVVCWNTRKGYLLELAAQGLPVIPTTLLRSPSDLAAIDGALAAGWSRVVVKPTVGVGSDGASRLPADPAAVADAAAALLGAGHEVLIQPYVEAIETEGETSTIVIDGRLSHCVRKVPAGGDFRSQPEHGGRLRLVDDDPALRELAEEAWHAAERVTGAALTYARVDTVPLDGRPHLMELELVEPDLFLSFPSPAVADRLVAAVQRRLE